MLDFGGGVLRFHEKNKLHLGRASDSNLAGKSEHEKAQGKQGMNFGLRKLSLSWSAVKASPRRGGAVTKSTSQTPASDECESSSGFRYRKLKTHRMGPQAQTQGTTHLTERVCSSAQKAGLGGALSLCKAKSTPSSIPVSSV